MSSTFPSRGPGRLPSHHRPSTPLSIIGHDEESNQSRRALVASAVASIQRFKQSWISIMILKAGISLGQVTTLITLLIVSLFLPSPLAPHDPQSKRSEACPRPVLFQAWMAINAFRLTLCWSASCWICFRCCGSQARQPESELEDTVPCPSIPVEPSTPSNTMSTPSLVHSGASSSSATLAGSSSFGSSSGTPMSISTTMMGSMLSLDYGDERKRPDTERVMTEVAIQDDRAFHGDRRSMQQTRETAQDTPSETDTEQEARQERRRNVADWLDRNALRISKACGTFSTILFILGNILVFYPLPTRTKSCYHASPLLWWGVMSVTGVGWVLFAQVFVVVVVVGIGGHTVVVILRRLHILPTPPQPEAPCAPQPAPLTCDELNKLKVVCFVPDSDESPSQNAFPTATLTEAAEPIDHSRLPYPPIQLKSYRSTCAICQEAFVPPRVGRAILLKADPLRLLGCGHVFHTGCIDQWLLEGSGNCPICNRSVRETTEGRNDKRRKESR